MATHALAKWLLNSYCHAETGFNHISISTLVSAFATTQHALSGHCLGCRALRIPKQLTWRTCCLRNKLGQLTLTGSGYSERGNQSKNPA